MYIYNVYIYIYNIYKNHHIYKLVLHAIKYRTTLREKYSNPGTSTTTLWVTFKEGHIELI